MDDPRHRRPRPRHHGPQAAGRDHPEVPVGPGGRPGAGRRARRGARDDRGRVRAVPAAPRLPRPDAAGPHRDGGGARAPRAPRLRDPGARAARSPTCRRSGTTSRPADRARRRPLRGPRPAARRRVDARPPRPPRRCRTGSSRRRSSCPSAPTRRSRRSTPTRSRPPARRSSSPTPTTSTCARATSASRELGGLHGFMGWDRPDPHRLRRLPGRLARRPAGDRRRRGDVQEPPRRVDPPLHAGALDRGPGGARRRTSRSPSTSRCSRARRGAVVEDAMHRTHRWAERSLDGAHADRPGAVRHRPGRPGPGAARGVGAVHRGPAVRRHQHRRARRRRDARASATRRWTRRSRTSTAIRGRAT